MKKRCLLLIAALILLFAACAFAEETEITLNGIVYTLNGDGTAVVTDYTEDVPSKVIIPEEVDGNTVIAIGEYAFFECNGLYSLYLPATVTSIGENAFSGCFLRYLDTYWTEEEVIGLIDQVGEYVYVGFAAEAGSDYKMSIAVDWEGDYHYGLMKYLGSAADLTLPEEKNGMPIKEIGPDFAKGNTTIRNLEIPQNYWGCGTSAFENCTALKTVNMRDYDNPFHASRMFAGCTALEEVIMNAPWEGAPNLGNYMFDGCTSLKKVTFPYTVVEYGGERIGSNWAEWGNYTFRNCVNLETIEVNPAMQVRCLQTGTFQNCKKLSYLACSSQMDVYINEAYGNVDPFDGCSSIKLGVFRGSAMEACAIENEIPYEYLDKDDDEYFYYSIDNVMEESYLTGLKKDISGAFDIPATMGGYPVVELNNSLFKNQSGITEITIPNTVRSIGVSCFSGCSGLTSVHLPARIEGIEDYVFKNCTGLKEVYLPDYMWWMSDCAFEGCGNLTFYVTEGSETQSLCDELGIKYILVVPVGIAVDFEKANLRLGDVFRVYVHRENSAEPLGADAISCKSSDEDVVSVNGNVFTAVAEGEAILTFTVLEGYESSASCTIEIGRPVMKFPGNVDRVEANAFEGDGKLYILDFTDTEFVTLEKDAFAGCTNLTTVYFAPGESHSVEAGALPDGILCIYDGENPDRMPISLVTEE